MKAILQKLKNFPWSPICLVLLVIIFFSIRLVITYDSAHYLNYVAIFEGELPTSSWDIVRGPVFPAVIFIFDTIFGKTSAGILVGTFIVYIIFTIVCCKICKEICQNFKHKNLIQNTILSILILNPLILGYFHVLLTEFIAITMAMLNILIAYKWIYFNTRSKKATILYILYFIFSVVFCYHLKQPYIIIALIPLLTACIISIVQKHSIKNIVYRTGTIIASLFFLIISITTWNKILNIMEVDTTTGRDSSSLFSQQLLQAYQITYDQDGDGKTDPLSVTDAVGVLFNDFISNPLRIFHTYVSNYCGISSICSIQSNDGVNYISTLQFAGLDTFENTAIGYRAYSSYSNLFNMPDQLYTKSIKYGESSNRGLLAFIINAFRIPTNILFKLSICICFPSLIFLIAIRIKDKNNKNTKLFHISLILLVTSFTHIALSAGIGLIIDRYAIEAFVPSILGISGTIIYFRLYSSQPPKALPVKTSKKVIKNAKS